MHRRGDADAVVANTDPQLLQALLLAQHLDLDTHLTGLGELDGIGQQVAEHLAQELFGAVLTWRQLGIDATAQHRVVVQGPRFEQGHDLVAQLAQGEIHRFRVAFALLQAGKVQHFVEDGQQAFAGLVQGIQALAVLGVEISLAQ
ncbi:hypothetical protein D3C81_1088160 [compost metagenome]